MPDHLTARRVLVVDGDDETGPELLLQLLEYGVAAQLCTDGADALLQTGATRPDVLLVSAELPVLGSAALIRAVRRRLSTPVLLGVGPHDADAAMEALTAGATACVARPYRIGEVLPLVSAMPHERVTGEDGILVMDGLALDTRAHEVRLHGRRIAMPERELKLLAALMRHGGNVVTQEQLRDEVWGPGHGRGTNTVVVHIRRLRARLGDAVGEPRILLTIRGAGYRLVPPPAIPAELASETAGGPAVRPTT